MIRVTADKTNATECELHVVTARQLVTSATVDRRHDEHESPLHRPYIAYSIRAAPSCVGVASKIILSITYI